MKSAKKTPGPVLPTRTYLPVVEVATACALNPVDFDNRFRPTDWGMPRDFTYVGRDMKIAYAETSLHALADHLFALGERDAALRLRDWILTLPARQSAEDGEQRAEDGKLVTVEHVVAGPDELDAAVAKLERRHASDREALPHNFLRDWEQEHE